MVGVRGGAGLLHAVGVEAGLLRAVRVRGGACCAWLGLGAALVTRFPPPPLLQRRPHLCGSTVSHILVVRDNPQCNVPPASAVPSGPVPSPALSWYSFHSAPCAPSPQESFSVTIYSSPEHAAADPPPPPPPPPSKRVRLTNTPSRLTAKAGCVWGGGGGGGGEGLEIGLKGVGSRPHRMSVCRHG